MGSRSHWRNTQPPHSLTEVQRRDSGSEGREAKDGRSMECEPLVPPPGVVRLRLHAGGQRRQGDEGREGRAGCAMPLTRPHMPSTRRQHIPRHVPDTSLDTSLDTSPTRPRHAHVHVLHAHDVSHVACCCLNCPRHVPDTSPTRPHRWSPSSTRSCAPSCCAASSRTSSSVRDLAEI